MMCSGFTKGVSLWYDITSHANDVVTLYWKYKGHISILLRAVISRQHYARAVAASTKLTIQSKYSVRGNCPTSHIYDQPQYDSNRYINRSALCPICVREINRIKFERDFYYKYVQHEKCDTQVDEVDFISLFIAKSLAVKPDI